MLSNGLSYANFGKAYLLSERLRVSMLVIIKKAKIEDAKILTEIQEMTFNDDTQKHLKIKKGGPCGYNSEDYQINMIKEYAYYKIIINDLIVGGFILSKINKNNVHVNRIYIHPEYQNKGIGKIAFEYMEKNYPDIVKWTLDTPEWAIRNIYFYESLDYREVKREYIKEGGFNLVFYEKLIK